MGPCCRTIRVMLCCVDIIGRLFLRSRVIICIIWSARRIQYRVRRQGVRILPDGTSRVSAAGAGRRSCRSGWLIKRLMGRQTRYYSRMEGGAGRSVRVASSRVSSARTNICWRYSLYRVKPGARENGEGSRCVPLAQCSTLPGY